MSSLRKGKVLVLLLALTAVCAPPPAAAEPEGDRRAESENTCLVAEAARCLGRALVHEARGEFASAVVSLDRARQLFRAAGEAENEAIATSTTARVHLQMGDAHTAQVLGVRALARLPEQCRRRTRIDLLIQLARSQVGLLKEDAALDTLDEALRLSRATADALSLARVHIEMGNAHLSLEAFEEALAYYERARSVGRTEGSVAVEAEALSRIARAHHGRGDVERATEHQKKALVLFEQEGRHREAITALIELGLARSDLGDVSGARILLTRARQEAERAGTRDLWVECLGAAAEAGLVCGDALFAAQEARRAVVDLPTRLAGLSEEQGALARETQSRVFEVGARAAIALDDDALLAFFLESGRAGVLHELLGEREAIQAVLVPPELAAAERRARTREAAAYRHYREVQDAGGRRERRRARASLDVARESLKEILERLQRTARAQVGTLLPPPASLAQIQGWLREGEVLVIYGLLRKDALALVVRPDSSRRVALGASREIESAYRALWLDDADRSTDGALDRLRALLVTPLGLEEADRRFLVSPDGIVSYVPFTPLVGNREVAYVPSGTTYGLLLQERDVRGEGVLALGDPLYGTNADPQVAASVRSGIDLAPLPYTREEVIAVGDVVLLGSEATEPGFRYSVSKRKRWRAVHIACHGVIDPDRPTLSALALTPSENDDGFLTALDVYRLRVPADIVVLSACDSGVGKIVNAEGVLGLMRAFMIAGAPRVLVSLGRVSDTATRAFMGAFYEHLSRGAAPTAALRHAQAHVRSHAAWAHPHYWASWALWGLPD